MEGGDGVVVWQDDAFYVDALLLVVDRFEGDGGWEAGDEVTAFGEEGERIGVCCGGCRLGICGLGGVDAFYGVDDRDRLFEEGLRAEVLHPVGVSGRR